MVVHGVTLQHHVIPQTSLLSAAAPTSSNTVAFDELQIRAARQFVDISDFRATANRLGWVRDKISGEFSFKSQLKYGALGVAPEMGAIFDNAFGTAGTVVASTSVTYNESTLEQGPGSFTLVEWGGGITDTSRNEYFMHQATGCVVKKLMFEIDGSEVTNVAGEGEFADYGYCFGAPLTSGSTAIGASTVTLDTGHDRRIRGGSAGIYLEFGSNDNSGAGYLVTDSTTTDEINVSPNIANTTIADGTLVRPVTLTSTYAGTHLSGVTNNLTLQDAVDSQTVPFNKASVEFETGLYLLNKNIGAVARAIGRTRRRWSGTITAYVENENAFIQAEGFEGTEYVMELRMGGSANGTRYRLSLPAVRVDVTGEYPFGREEDGTEIAMNFESRESSGVVAQLIQD